MSAPNKEQVYDAEISPLMLQIIETCQKHGIAMVASFRIPTPEDAGLSCSSKVPDESGNPHPLAGAMDRWMHGERTSLAITVMGPKGGA